jgi:hypothetical protein
VTEDSAPRLFGFVQFDLAGTLAVADGRYVVRGSGDETVLVVETLGAPAPPRRRRRRPRESAPDSDPQTLPLARVTVVRSAHRFTDEEDAGRWLDDVVADEAAIDGLLAEGLALLNRALHVNAVASGDPHPQAFAPGRTAAVRIGFGNGEQVADGEFSRAREIDVQGGVSRRRQRSEALRPQERLAGVLGGRERLDACETLLLRARADLDAGRTREAALQLRVGLDALLSELPGTVADTTHDEDITTLEARRDEATAAAETALRRDLDASQLPSIGDLLQLSERVLRRRRVLNG